ncbi:MAG: hypothetical protein Q8R78_05755, partial [Candidatus Omnitrophota bacterium]|nr:hypothetical protein [Candidatus Omnitrophota bacterium]
MRDEEAEEAFHRIEEDDGDQLELSDSFVTLRGLMRLAGVSVREQNVVLLRVFGGLPFATIGRLFEFSESLAHRLYHKAVKRMAPALRRWLDQVAPDRVASSEPPIPPVTGGAEGMPWKPVGTREEAEAFAKGSSITRTLYRGTTAKRAEAAKHDGLTSPLPTISVTANRDLANAAAQSNASWVYPREGAPIVVAVKVRLLKPLLFDQLTPEEQEELDRAIEELAGEAVEDIESLRLIHILSALGYDALSHRGLEDLMVFDKRSIMIIEEPEPSAGGPATPEPTDLHPYRSEPPRFTIGDPTNDHLGPAFLTGPEEVSDTNGKIVVEVGTQTGRLAEALARAGRPVRVYALDPMPSKSAYPRLKALDGVTLISVRLEDWDAPELAGQVDEMYFFFPEMGYDEFKNARAAIAKKIAQLLRPGTGTFTLVTEWDLDALAEVWGTESFTETLRQAGLEVDVTAASRGQLTAIVPEIIHSEKIGTFLRPDNRARFERDHAAWYGVGTSVLRVRVPQAPPGGAGSTRLSGLRPAPDDTGSRLGPVGREIGDVSISSVSRGRQEPSREERAYEAAARDLIGLLQDLKDVDADPGVLARTRLRSIRAYARSLPPRLEGPVVRGFPADDLTQRARALGRRIRAYRPRFIQAERAGDEETLVRLNREVVPLLKERLQIQLHLVGRRLAAAHQDRRRLPVAISTVRSAWLIAQGLAYEYSWRRRRQQKPELISWIKTVGSRGQLLYVKTLEDMGITAEPLDEREPVIATQKRWVKTRLPSGRVEYREELRDVTYPDGLASAFRGYQHMIETYQKEYPAIVAYLEDLRRATEALAPSADGETPRRNVSPEAKQWAAYLLGRVWAAMERARRTDKRDAVREVDLALKVLRRGRVESARRLIRAALQNVEHRRRDIAQKVPFINDKREGLFVHLRNVKLVEALRAAGEELRDGFFDAARATLQEHYDWYFAEIVEDAAAEELASYHTTYQWFQKRLAELIHRVDHLVATEPELSSRVNALSVKRATEWALLDRLESGQVEPEEIRDELHVLQANIEDLAAEVEPALRPIETELVDFLRQVELHDRSLVRNLERTITNAKPNAAAGRQPHANKRRGRVPGVDEAAEALAARGVRVGQLKDAGIHRVGDLRKFTADQLSILGLSQSQVRALQQAWGPHGLGPRENTLSPARARVLIATAIAASQKRHAFMRRLQRDAPELWETFFEISQTFGGRARVQQLGRLARLYGLDDAELLPLLGWFASVSGGAGSPLPTMVELVLEQFRTTLTRHERALLLGYIAEFDEEAADAAAQEEVLPMHFLHEILLRRLSTARLEVYRRALQESDRELLAAFPSFRDKVLRLARDVEHAATTIQLVEELTAHDTAFLTAFAGLLSQDEQRLIWAFLFRTDRWFAPQFLASGAEPVVIQRILEPKMLFTYANEYDQAGGLDELEGLLAAAQLQRAYQPHLESLRRKTDALIQINALFEDLNRSQIPLDTGGLVLELVLAADVDRKLELIRTLRQRPEWRRIAPAFWQQVRPEV